MAEVPHDVVRAAQHNSGVAQTVNDIAWNGDPTGAQGRFGTMGIPDWLSSAGANAEQIDPEKSPWFRDWAAQSAQFDPNSYGGQGQQQLGLAGAYAGGLDQYNTYLRGQAAGNGGPATEAARAALAARMSTNAAVAGGARGGQLAAAGRGARVANQDLGLQSQAQLDAVRAQEAQRAQAQLVQNNAALTQAGVVGANTAAGNADLISRGQQASMSNQAALAGQLHTGQFAQGQAVNTANQNYTDWLNNQYAISAGVAPQYAGPGTQLGIAGDEIYTNYVGGALSGAGAALGSALGSRDPKEQR